MEELQIKDMGQNRFLFSFPSITARDRVLKQGPWNFRGSLMILKDWKLEATINDIDLSKATFWIRIHGLPLKGLEVVNAIWIGSKLGEVLEVDEMDENRLFLRVRVQINLEASLQPDFFIPRRGNQRS